MFSFNYPQGISFEKQNPCYGHYRVKLMVKVDRGQISTDSIGTLFGEGLEYVHP